MNLAEFYSEYTKCIIDNNDIKAVYIRAKTGRFKNKLMHCSNLKYDEGTRTLSFYSSGYRNKCMLKFIQTKIKAILFDFGRVTGGLDLLTSINVKVFDKVSVKHEVNSLNVMFTDGFYILVINCD